MAFPKYKDLDNLTSLIEIENEILLQEKNLFELKVKKKEKSFQTNLYMYLKRRIAQLEFKKSTLQKLERKKI